MKYTAAALLICFLVSCRPKPVPGITERAVAQLEAATKATEQANVTLFLDFDNKLHDPQTASHAAIWQPKALQVKNISDSLISHIDSWEAGFKKAIPDSNDFTKKLSDGQRRLLRSLDEDLRTYPDNLYKIDPEVSRQFTNQLDAPDVLSPQIKAATIGEAYLQLAVIKNMIRQNENKVVTFLKNHIGQVDGPGSYDQFSAIVGQSSNILKPGDKLTLTAGVGSFSTNSKPQFIMNGKSIFPDADGVGVYEMRVPQKPGKYHVPVLIKFVKADGTEDSKTYTLEYEVAKPTE